MVVTVVSKRFIPWDGPRLRVVGGLLPMELRSHHGVVGGLLLVGSAKSPTAVVVSYERGMNCYDPL